MYTVKEMIKENFDEVYKRALIDPSSVFKDPQDIFDATHLTHQQKIELLRRWDVDALEIETAQTEGMIDGERSHLREIHLLLNKLEKTGG